MFLLSFKAPVVESKVDDTDVAIVVELFVFNVYNTFSSITCSSFNNLAVKSLFALSLPLFHCEPVSFVSVLFKRSFKAFNAF